MMIKKMEQDSHIKLLMTKSREAFLLFLSLMVTSTLVAANSCRVSVGDKNLGVREDRPRRTRVNTELFSPEFVAIQEDMQKSVIGQPSSIEAYLRVLSRVKAGVKRRGMSGAILVYGPTGVGKTKGAESLAKAIDANIIRIEGGNYTTSTSITSLTGASPVWAGHGKSKPIITQSEIEKSRGKKVPITIILINELDKAHQLFLDWWLKGMDDGFNEAWIPEENPKDSNNPASKSERIDFTNVILIATTNGAAEAVQQESTYLIDYAKKLYPEKIDQLEGVSNLKALVSSDQSYTETAKKELIAKFQRPEFLGRWDELIPAYPLLKTGYNRVLSLELERITNQYVVASNGLGLKIRLTKQARNWLLQQIDETFGARNLSKVMDRLIESPITKAIGSGQIEYGNLVSVDLNAARDGFDFFKQTAKNPGVPITKVEGSNFIRSEAVQKIIAESESTKKLDLIQALIESSKSFTSEEALELINLIPHGVAFGYKNPTQDSYFPTRFLKESKLGLWEPVDFEYMDISVLFHLLANTKKPIEAELLPQLSQASLSLISNSKGIVGKRSEYVSQLYLAVGILLAK